jgi:hypothetical protein
VFFAALSVKSVHGDTKTSGEADVVPVAGEGSLLGRQVKKCYWGQG